MAKRASRQEKVASELEGVRLGDPRRSRRAMEITRRLAAQPEASLPDAMLDPGMLEAVYRHLSSREISFEALIEPHIQKSAARVEHATTAYAIHDTVQGQKCIKDDLGHTLALHQDDEPHRHESTD
jgi:transposase-like protein